MTKARQKTSKITQFDFQVILDDLKLIAKSHKISIDENDQIKREYAGGLTTDLINRLYRDIEKLTDKKEKDPKTFGGTINEIEVDK